MNEDVSYTTEEIAKLLKISKLTVYDLIKKGDLPAYRVGKQMRVDASDLEAYKTKTKGGQPPAAKLAYESVRQPAFVSGGARPIVVTGQDISLDILVKFLEKKAPSFRPLRSYVGSIDSLISMYHGESDIVSMHLLDGDSMEYNIPYVRKILVGFSYIVVNLLTRQAGLYVKKGNPKQIRTWADLKKPGIRIVNREIGSGARVLLDEQLRLHHISPAELDGYQAEESSHVSVAAKVAAGEADVGVGIEKAAQLIKGAEFIPLIQERYDLVMLKLPRNKEWIDAVMEVLRSEAFRNELGSIGGYDLSLTGNILWET